MTTPDAGSLPAPVLLRRRATYVLARLALASRRTCQDHLAAVGIGQWPHAVLACLDEFGPQIQRDVAARLGVDSGDMVAFVDELHGAGLVLRERDARDRRRQILSITAAGKRMLRKAEQALDESTAATFAPLVEAERDQLHELMLRVLAHQDPATWADDGSS